MEGNISRCSSVRPEKIFCLVRLVYHGHGMVNEMGNVFDDLHLLQCSLRVTAELDGGGMGP